MRLSGFAWDDGNRESTRHGLSLKEIEALFTRPVAVRPDVAHGGTEARFLAVGQNAEGRHVFVAFTWRLRLGNRYLRPISARYMPKKEV